VRVLVVRLSERALRAVVSRARGRPWAPPGGFEESRDHVVVGTERRSLPWFEFSVLTRLVLAVMCPILFRRGYRISTIVRVCGAPGLHVWCDNCPGCGDAVELTDLARSIDSLQRAASKFEVGFADTAYDRGSS
jgi:hypothetical protein